MCVGVYLHICTPGLQLCVRRVCMYVCIYLHTCAPNPHVGCIYLHICTRAYKCMHTCLFLFMCVKDTVGAYGSNVCIYKYMYTHLGLYVCVYVCTPIHICIERHRVCMQSVCIQIQTCLCLYLVYR